MDLLVGADKSSVAMAHAQLVAAGVRDSGRATATLREVEAAYAAAVSSEALPRPRKGLVQQLQQLRQAVLADLVRSAHHTTCMPVPMPV